MANHPTNEKDRLHRLEVGAEFSRGSAEMPQGRKLSVPEDLSHAGEDLQGKVGIISSAKKRRHIPGNRHIDPRVPVKPSMSFVACERRNGHSSRHERANGPLISIMPINDINKPFIIGIIENQGEVSSSFESIPSLPNR
jgi:hypothetical protein